MIPQHIIIEEERKKRERRAQEQRIPLYAPSPLPPRRQERPTEDSNGGSVIIIDIGDYSEERR